MLGKVEDRADPNIKVCPSFFQQIENDVDLFEIFQRHDTAPNAGLLDLESASMLSEYNSAAGLFRHEGSHACLNTMDHVYTLNLTESLGADKTREQEQKDRAATLVFEWGKNMVAEHIDTGVKPREEVGDAAAVPAWMKDKLEKCKIQKTDDRVFGIYFVNRITRKPTGLDKDMILRLNLQRY